MEDYAAKMALKPDAALREYVVGHAQYREAAVLAALDELRRRGQPAPEDATLRALLEAAVQAQLATEQAAPPSTKADATVPEAEQPVLYTPGVIVLFSVLFNTIAGAILLGINLYQVNRKKAISGLYYSTW
jgi:cobalamin biosynthesis Mg chelatase CobN